jgi:hypothetical protein
VERVGQPADLAPQLAAVFPFAALRSDPQERPLRGGAAEFNPTSTG